MDQYEGETSEMEEPLINTPFKRSILLLLIGIFLTGLYFFLPSNERWLKSRIIPYYNSMASQKNDLNPESRKIKRWGTDYIYSKQISSFFEKKGIKDQVLVLMPPTKYFREKSLEYHVPEPAVFYYYTGLRTTWPNSAEAKKANWIVWAHMGNIFIDSVKNDQQLADSIEVFKKFPIRL